MKPEDGGGIVHIGAAFRGVIRAMTRDRRMFRLACVGFAVVVPLLAGCASQPKADTAAVAGGVRQPVAAQGLADVQANDRQRTEYQQILAELRRASECVSVTEAKPEFAPLRARAPNGAQGGAYPSQMSDRNKATAAEGRLIVSFVEMIVPCQPNFPPLTVRVHQSITRMINETWMQQRDLYRQLKDGQIAWGVFNQGTRSNADRLSGGLQALRLSNDG